jgi:hypothetical protein
VSVYVIMKSKSETNLWTSIKALFRGPEDSIVSVDPAAAIKAENAARIDELMALPIKARSSVTVVGDDGVSGYNPRRPDGP